MKLKFNFSHIPYIIIAILLILLYLKGCQKPTEKPEKVIIKTDTVYKYVEVLKTIQGKPIFVQGKTNNTWIDKKNFVPKSTYDSLLEQYKGLGTLYFKKNVFETKFKIDTFGYILVKDTISENWLESSKMTTFLKFPEKTIINKEKELLKQKNQLYVGLIITGTKKDIISSANVGLLLKDKRDRLFGGFIGITPQGTQFGMQSYLKIRLKR